MLSEAVMWVDASAAVPCGTYDGDTRRKRIPQLAGEELIGRKPV
jgi:hypothetical protein